MKREYTIGQIAKIINVARSTVINWIKDGRITAFQLPGGNNRVTRENLVKFMREYNIPLDFIDQDTQKRVLVVDDDLDLLKVLETAISRDEEFSVRIASTGFQSGLLTKEFRPHIIVLDIGLEDIDGREVCRTVRSDPELSEAKVLAISGQIAQEDEKTLAEDGFDGFMRKPFDVKDIVARLRSMMKM